MRERGAGVLVNGGGGAVRTAAEREAKATCSSHHTCGVRKRVWCWYVGIVHCHGSYSGKKIQGLLEGNNW